MEKDVETMKKLILKNVVTTQMVSSSRGRLDFFYLHCLIKRARGIPGNYPTLEGCIGLRVVYTTLAKLDHFI